MHPLPFAPVQAFARWVPAIGAGAVVRALRVSSDHVDVPLQTLEVVQC